MRSKIGLSSWRLELADGVVRLPPRNQAMRPANYEDRYDFQTVVYDVFWSHDGTTVVVTAAPFLSLDEDLPLSATALPSGEACAVRTDINPNFTRLVLTPPPGTTGLQLDSKLGRVVLAVQPSLAHVFRERRVIYTLQQNNDLAWIRDWAHFYAREHGADAAVIYDNASTRYELGEIAHALDSVDGIEEVAVVDWPFPYGAFDLREELSWNLIDSIYCQFAAFDHLHRRLTPLAAGVLNADLDEIVIRTGERTLFEAAEQAPGGYAQFEGYWVENVRAAGRFGDADVRHRDFVFTMAPEPAVSEPKWAMAPEKLDPDVVLSVHDLHNAYRGPADDFCLYHFKGINTMWDTDRPLIGQRREEVLFDEAAGEHRPADDLAETLARVFGDDPGYAPQSPPDSPDIAGHIARLRSGKAKAAGRTDAAAAAAREALAHLPGMQSFCEHLAALLGDGEEAEALRTQAAALREADYGFHLQRARRLFDFGDPEESAAVYRRCLELRPGDPVALQGWLYCLAETEAFREAVAAAADAVEDAPEYSTFASLVPVFRALGKWQEIEVLVSRALAKNPDDPYLVGLSASINVVMRRIPAARATLDRARALNTPAAFRERLAIVNRRGRPSREYAEWDPEQGRLSHIETQIAQAEGNLGEAARLARDAADRAYPFAPYEMHLANVLERCGRPEEAQAARGRAVTVAERRAMKRPPTHFGSRAAAKFRQRNLMGLIQVLIGTGAKDRALAAIDDAKRDSLASSDFLGSVAQFWLAAGEHAEAERSARDALALAPDNVKLKGLLGRVLVAAGDREAAKLILREALAADGTQVDLRLTLAQACRADGQTDEAVAAVRQVLAVDPKHGPAHGLLVTLLAEAERFAEAEASVEAAILEEPGVDRFHTSLAYALIRANRIEEAIDAVTVGRRHCPESVILAQTHANLFNRAERFAEAEVAAREATRLRSSDPQSWNALVHALMKQNKWAEAIEVHQTQLAIAAPADQPQLRRRLAHLLLRERRAEEAAAVLATIDAAHDDDSLRALREDVERHRSRDRHASRAAAPEGAADTKSPPASPGNPIVSPESNGRASVRPAPEATIEKASRAQATPAMPAAEDGNLVRALKDANQAVAADPEQAALRAHRADLLERLGRRQEAERALRYAIELAPDDADLRVRLGRALLARDARAAAIEAFEAAVRLDPESAAAADALRAHGEQDDQAESEFKRS